MRFKDSKAMSIAFLSTTDCFLFLATNKEYPQFPQKNSEAVARFPDVFHFTHQRKRNIDQ